MTHQTYRNEEASIFMRGTVDDEPLQEILNAVSSWWNESNQIEDDWLNAYELRWTNNQKHKEAIEKPLKIYKPSPKAEHSDILFKTWGDYVIALYDSMDKETIDTRLQTLQHAHQLFANVANFNQLDEFQRKAIAGIIGSNEILGTGLEPFEWGAFGSMTGLGDFRNRILENDIHLSNALDFIPFTGVVTEDDYNGFSEEFILAFENSTRCGGVPTASRLLAMKRPDYFVCVNKKIKKGWQRILAFHIPDLTLTIIGSLLSSQSRNHAGGMNKDQPMMNK